MAEKKSQQSEQKDYTKPPQLCDIILKGGITSGIVYPKAIYELAKEYQFSCIGGTSAGAIAAVLTAAAEYNRQKNGSFEGFEILNKLPDELKEKIGSDTKLLSLFQPMPSTKKVFSIFMHLVREKSIIKRIIFSVSSLIKNFPLITLWSSLPAILLIYTYIVKYPINLFFGLLTFFILFTTMLIIIIATSIRFGISFQQILVKNEFGLVNGYMTSEKINQEPLTLWLSKLINKVAGIDENGAPLTFGDLENTSDLDKGITLNMYTTNLSWGRPYSLPFNNSQFFFQENQMREYFPDNVVNKMIEGIEIVKDGKLDRKFQFPSYKTLPLIVAARMSLSFPFLINAIPLYAINYEEKSKPFEKCLFSDGGICSNFPIHLFDKPLPKHPSFGINLTRFNEMDTEDETRNILMIDRINSFVLPWNKNINSIKQFISSITSTMQNWSDNTLAQAKGYRDRIVHVHLSEKEGGLNLDMEENLITNISERGKFAGKILKQRFLRDGDYLNWNHHKWIRFQEMMRLLNIYLNDIEDALKMNSTKYNTSYMDLLNRNLKNLPPGHFRSHKYQNEVINYINELRKHIQKYPMLKKIYVDKTNSSPELKVKPKV